uniref:Uncharacterized protein n=1 Tax=Oryza brachyantha TaxID=4533 RepID=J3MH01_ORYBR
MCICTGGSIIEKRNIARRHGSEDALYCCLFVVIDRARPWHPPAGRGRQDRCVSSFLPACGLPIWMTICPPYYLSIYLSIYLLCIWKITGCASGRPDSEVDAHWVICHSSHVCFSGLHIF